MFVLKFVLTMCDDPALHVPIGYFDKTASRTARCLIFVNICNKVQNAFHNVVINV